MGHPASAGDADNESSGEGFAAFLSLDDAQKVSEAAQFSSKDKAMLGRLGAIVSPVHGSADFRHTLTEKRAQQLVGSPGPLQKVHALRSAAVEHWRDTVDAREREFLQLRLQAERAGYAMETRLLRPRSQPLPEPSRSALAHSADNSADLPALLEQQEKELERAKVQLAEAEEARGLTELAIHNALAKGEQEQSSSPNGNHSFLVAMRASALARNRRLEEASRASRQVSRARAKLTAARQAQDQGDGGDSASASVPRPKAQTVTLRRFVSEASLNLDSPSSKLDSREPTPMGVTSMQRRIKALQERAAARTPGCRSTGSLPSDAHLDSFADPNRATSRVQPSMARGNLIIGGEPKLVKAKHKSRDG